MDKKRRLSRKFILGFVLIGIVISMVSIVIGVHGFSKYIRKQYNDTAYDIAETVENLFAEDELLDYAKKLGQWHGESEEDRYHDIMGSERYQTISRQIDSLRTCMGANDIFVAVINLEMLNEREAAGADWAPLQYLFDTYAEEEKSYRFGETGAFNPEFLSDIKRQMESYSRGTNYYVSESSFGYNTSAVLPVRLKEKDIHVLIGVEIPMESLQHAVSELSFHTLGSIVATMAVIIVLFVYYLYYTVIKPIDIIAEETEQFGRSGKELSMRLSDIQTGDELQGLAEAVLRMEQGILDYVNNITAITAEKERISTELNVATEIQANMLPRLFPAFPDRREFDIYASMIPAKEVGGDFYDFFLVDENHLAMVIGDVSGKGVPAALYMVIAKTLLKNRAGDSLSPGAVLEEVNEQLCENNASGMFVTVWLGILEIPTGTVCAANAGHEFPAVRGKKGIFTLLEDYHGFVLGGMEGSKYREYTFELERGDALFVYTDGVPEATNAEDVLFGTERMLVALNNDPYDSPETMVKRMRDVIDGFVSRVPQFDDMTMLFLERK